MISFLTPLFLLAAVAAAIPIIIHLIRRREVRRVMFPAVRYLRRAEKRHAKRIKIRHLLLLATRVAIILTLAALAAGPLIGRGGPADHEPTALAVIIDNSQSSTRLYDGRRIIDAFIERARESLNLVTPDDRVALFSAASGDQPLIVQGAGPIDHELDELEPSAAIADLSGSIRRADAWTRSVADERRRELHVLTDLQRVSIDPEPREGTEGEGLGIVVFAPSLEPSSNGAVGIPRPEVVPLDAGRETRIFVPLHWYGPEPPAEPIVVRLTLHGSVVGVAEGEFGSSVLLRLPPQDSGWVAGHVEIDNHGLAADDRRYFTWFARPAVRVAALGEVGEFVRQAIDALSAGGRVRSVPPGAAEVWIAGSGERLEAGLSDGRAVLVVPPASPLDLPLLNRRLTAAGLSWRYETVEAGGASRLDDTPLVDGLGGTPVDFWYRLVPTGLATADSALLSLMTGEPWLVQGRSTGGTYLLLASPLTPEASAVPVSAAMVPLLDAALSGWMRGAGGSQPDDVVEGGSAVRLTPRASSIELPNGETEAVEGGSLFVPWIAGDYEVRGAEGVAFAFSVGAPEAESNPARATRSELSAVAPDADWTWVERGAAEAWRRSVFRARRGRLASFPLILLLVVLALLEASLAAAGRRRESPAISRAVDRKTERDTVEVP